MTEDIMRKRYQSLPLKELREIAKSRGLQRISGIRKELLIEKMIGLDKEEKLYDEPAAEKPAANVTKETDLPADLPDAPKPPVSGGGPEEAAEGLSEKEEEKPGKKEGSGGRPKKAEADKADASETKGRTSKKKNERKKKIREAAPTEDAVRTSDAAAATAPAEADGRADAEAKDRGRQQARQKRSGSPDKNISPTKTAPAREEAAEPNAGEKNRVREEARPKEPVTEEEQQEELIKKELHDLDSGIERTGVMEVMAEGFGFIRSDNYLPGSEDIYISPTQIKRFRLKTGDLVCGNIRIRTQNEKFSALLYVKSVNGIAPGVNARRPNFEDMTPVFPNQRIHLERPGGSVAMRIVDLVSPIGKGQRGMIVSPPKAGKTTLLKDAARSILRNNPEMHIIILLIDERPEEVTDIRETVVGENVEVIYSTFDELPEHHKKVSEMVIERAKRLVENHRDVIIFIDSITRLARAYNQIVPPSGRTLSGGLDPASLHMPKRFFGAARNMREGGSLTILATALVDTGSKMDDVVYEEFKGTGNMELILDRRLQERRVFPAIDLAKSGTRREDLLLTRDEAEAVNNMRRALNGMRAEEAGENILNMFTHSRNNADLVQMLKRQRIV